MLKYIFVLSCFYMIKHSDGVCAGIFAKNHRNFRLFSKHREICGRGFYERNAHRRPEDWDTETPNLAVLGEFPWLLQLTIYTKENNIKGCAGALISERYALTAGQCIVFKDPNDPTGMKLTQIKRIKVIIGEYNLEFPKDCDGRKCAPPAYANYVTDLYLDDKFRLTDKFKDIALLRLRCRVPFTLYVKPVCLPFECVMKFAVYDDIQIQLAGWGLESPTSLSAAENNTVKINTKVLSYNSCNQTFENRYAIRPDLGRRIYKFLQCSTVHGQVRFCRVDYGSPATVVVRTQRKCDCTRESGIEHVPEEDEERAVLIGVVTDGLTCSDPLSEGKPNYSPKIQTRVAPWLNWILDRVRD